MRSSDWSSDVCSSDLLGSGPVFDHVGELVVANDDQKVIIRLIAADGVVDPVAARIGAVEHDLEDERDLHKPVALVGRSEERLVGKECVRTWRSRWSPDP